MQHKSKLLLVLLFCAFLLALGQERAVAKDLIYIVKDYSELKSLPAFSFRSPPGLSLKGGVAFVGIGGLLDAGRVDGAAAIGTGFGDPIKGLGGSVSIVPGSLNFDGGFLNYGFLSGAVGHTYVDQLMGVSFGIQQISLWHSTAGQVLNPSWFLSSTKVFATAMPTVLTVGFGNNQYADADYQNNPYAVNQYGLFASAAVFVHPQMSFIVDYMGKLTSVAVGIVPCPDVPLSFTIGANGFFKELASGQVSLVATGAVSFAY